jgi:hypothetical protein
MDLHPRHPALRILEEAFVCLGSIQRPEVHVRADECAATGVFREQLVRPGEDVVGRVALEVEVDEVETAGGEKLVAVHVVAGDVLRRAFGLETTPVPRKLPEALGGKIPLEQRGVAIALHVVVTDGEAVGHDAMEPIQALARETPLVVVVDVDDVTDVADEDDVLGADVFDDPAGVVLENGIGERRRAVGRALGRAAIVALRVGDDYEGEGARRRRVEVGGAERGRNSQQRGERGQNPTPAWHGGGGRVHRSRVTPKLIDQS